MEAAPPAGFQKLWPFMLGAAIGVPLGVSILTWANSAHVRQSVGVFLVLYNLYSFSPGVPAGYRGRQGRRRRRWLSMACSAASPGLPGFW
jgi:uncharacterized membrane protein YfcA